MAKSFDYNNYSRVLFPKNKQKQFLEKAKNILELTNKKFANFANVNIRTLSDWKREKFTIPLGFVQKIQLKTQIVLPKTVKILPAFWSTKKAAKLGAQAMIKKYGRLNIDEKKRRNGWYNWWYTKGHHIKNIQNQPKEVFLPKKDIVLAEFVGILIGDGGITNYQITITLNKKDDKEYAEFVVDLIKQLFKIKPSIHIRESVVNIKISRIKLIIYLQKLGLKKGNKIKQNVDMPNWIKNNENYSLACIRGLVDTDGCVYRHQYKVKEKIYHYKKIGFSSRSKNLIESVKNIMSKNGLHPKIDCRGDIRLYSLADVKKYFQVIGSHNPKHLRKVEKLLGGLRRIGKPAVC